MRARAALLLTAMLVAAGIASCSLTTDLDGLSSGNAGKAPAGPTEDASATRDGKSGNGTNDGGTGTNDGGGLTPFDAGGSFAQCPNGTYGGSGSGAQCQYNASLTCQDGSAYSIFCSCPTATCTCSKNGVPYATVPGACPCPSLLKGPPSSVYTSCGIAR